MDATSQTLEFPELLKSLLPQINFNDIPPNQSMLKSPSNTFFWVQASILEKFGETNQDALDDVFEKFQWFENHHPKEFPQAMSKVITTAWSWLEEYTPGQALKKVIGRFWNQNVETEYRHWIQKNHPEIFKDLYVTKKTDLRTTEALRSIHHKKTKWRTESPEKFFDRHYPSWPFARLYRLAKTNNFHDSGVKQYWVLSMSQKEFSRKARTSLSTIERFFHVSKRHGICLKIFKEDPPWKDFKKKEGPKKGHCATWIFAKNMSEAQRNLRAWRSVRPHLQKLLTRLRPDKTF